MRADAFKREPDLIRLDVYRWQEKREGKQFTLHDGPPYANGSPHMGHALNKILKDVTNRYKILQGYRVNYIPGWDCHGLPIELKALELLKGAQRNELTPQKIRTQAKSFALSQIEVQKKEFVRWGVLGDWDDPYLTMDPRYEAQQLGVFLKMFSAGLIYRDYKPVYWSPSSKTALAEAELEYNENHVSPSVFVLFPIKSISPDLSSKLSIPLSNLHAAIWTTTPWTLSANMAICVGETIEYSIVSYETESCEKQFIIATSLLPSVQEKLEKPLKVLATNVLGKDIVGTTYQHPFIDRESPVLNGSHVTIDSGTGLVHTAPGHGLDDYLVCNKNSVSIVCHVDDDGCFTSEAGERLKGKFILTHGNEEVIKILTEQNALLHHESFSHKYPYDWRTKKPVILRATKQWFADVYHIKKKSIEKLQDVQIIPSSGKLRLSNMVDQRDFWCISRQRHWGVPIPVLYDVETDEPFINEENVQYIQQLVEKHGTDCWWDLPDMELVHPKFRGLGKTYRKGMDTMDVWFDSGSSWAGVLQGRNIPLPADMYLEGSDQHRGWFQSSLLTAISVLNTPPYKAVLTHGFVLDGNLQKMSKSLGNVIEPSFIIEGGKNKQKDPPYGVDVLRLLVSSTDYTKDVGVSSDVIQSTSNNMKKIRNSARFLLGNLYDFKAGIDDVPYEQMFYVDQYMLSRLNQLIVEVTDAYDHYLFFKVQKSLLNFCINDLSSFYMNISKDRLYSELPNDLKRRSVQTVFYRILDVLTVMLAPIACHTTEDIYKNMTYKSNKNEISSVFGESWPQTTPSWSSAQIDGDWTEILEIKTYINYLVEVQRSKDDANIKTSMEVEATLYVPSDHPIRKMSHYEIEELFIVPIVHLKDYDSLTESERQLSSPNTTTSQRPFQAIIEKSKKNKCHRCWRHNCDEQEEICTRCHQVVAQL